MGRQRHFRWSGGVREASQWPEVTRAAVLRPVAGGGLGCLTREGKKPGWAGVGPKGCGDFCRRWNFQRKSGWAAMAIGPN
jgi:hypothetical protein